MNTHNNMNSLKNYFFILTMCFSISTYSQQNKCDELEPIVADLLNSSNNNSSSIFISDGQVYKAFINNDEKAEFKATLYGGSTYRIAAATAKSKALIFEIENTGTNDENKSSTRNTLFSNKEFDNSPYWDFKIENTIDCYIKAKLDLNVALSGCMVMMIGFEKSN